MKVWDLPTRLYHWLQAILFTLLALSGFNGGGPHIAFGLALFALLLWRISWGIVGSDTSRFAQFIHSPRIVISYLKGKYRSKPGHNPAGALMVFSLLTILTLQCLSGLALTGWFDNFSMLGSILDEPFYSTAENVHLFTAKALMGLVFTHLAAIFFYKLRNKPLVLAMVTGKQQNNIEMPSVALHFASNIKALVLFVAALSVTMAIVASL
ncbi:cytochrome b/b6 domain-containing protein [Photobacterium lutimaris]|uniref:Hydrogenase n=1 Tax=Photobacterium lutimaris TaxID=388278 RepID=A0A2T3J3M2_9GAMM|nr:cytochrome b/b6 domain-containing protein [Photobacterium lutimaris]PSU35897.1 hydrogenase [Photobacterium lutimaris]TDR78971.1 cytochrome b [Photobacterium lutimaris]